MVEDSRRCISERLVADGNGGGDMRGLYTPKAIGESPLVYVAKKQRIAEKFCLDF